MQKIPQTSIPLGANGVFTGAEIDTLNNVGDQVVANLYSDQASATNGAMLQGSDDNVNWYPMTQGSLTANTPLQLSAYIVHRYIRVELTNGATAQTSLNVAAGIA